MPGDPVTKERVETVLLGIATEIASGMAEVKSEMSGLINDAELCWQATLAEQSKGDPYYGSPGSGAAGAHSDFAALREAFAQGQATVEGTLRAQDAELSSSNRASPTLRRRRDARKLPQASNSSSGPRPFSTR